MRKLTRHLWGLLRSPVTRIFLLLVLQHCPVRSCPLQCTCDQTINGTIVMCSDKKLNAIPEGIPLDTFELDLSSNNIADLTLPAGSTTVYRNVNKILINYNQVKVIFSNFFTKSFPNVEVINLDGNSINDIHFNAFSGLNKLRQLHLENNQIGVLKPFTFKQLTLNVLNLDRNNLRNIEDSVFESSSIKTLRLEYNDLTKLNNVMLKPLQSSLKHFYLSNNKSPLQLDKQTFNNFQLDDLTLCYNGISNCSFLSSVDTKILDLSGNPLDIVEFHNYPNLHRVEELMLVNTSIQALSAEYFKHINNLKLLDLSYNKIRTFSDSVFENNGNLETLQLNHNHLWKLPEGIGKTCPNLVKLMLASNKISIITAEHFTGMNLKELDLSFNIIQVFEEALKPIFNDIPMLALNGNPFHCNCEMRWFREWLSTRTYYIGVDKCHSPKEVNIYDMTPEQFVCKKPVLLFTTPDVSVMEGEDVLLSCTAQGDPAPEISFSDPATEGISISPQKNRTKTKTYAMWKVNSIPYYRAGYYICKASNVIGTVVGSICVSVKSPDSNAGEKACKPTTALTSMTTIPLTTQSKTSPASTTISLVTTTSHVTNSPDQSRPPSNILKSTTTTRKYVTPTVNAVDRRPSAGKLWLIGILVLAGVTLLVVIVIVLICRARRRRAIGRYSVSKTDDLEYHKMNGKPPIDVVCNGHAYL